MHAQLLKVRCFQCDCNWDSMLYQNALNLFSFSCELVIAGSWRLGLGLGASAVGGSLGKCFLWLHQLKHLAKLIFYTKMRVNCTIFSEICEEFLGKGIFSVSVFLHGLTPTIKSKVDICTAHNATSTTQECKTNQYYSHEAERSGSLT
jgi:hypothetical protein